MNAKSSYLKHYYGKLEGTGTNFAGGMTHDQIAGVMGISRSRVWQIERRALRKLARNPVMRRMLGMANFTPANTTPPPEIPRSIVAWYTCDRCEALLHPAITACPWCLRYGSANVDVVTAAGRPDGLPAPSPGARA